jgi:cell division septation protein DedD
MALSLLAKPVEPQPIAPADTARKTEGRRQATPWASPTAAPTVKAASQRRRWSVQVGASRDRREAFTLMRKLRREGYEAYVVKVRRGAKTWHRVRLGGFGSLGEASRAAASLKRRQAVRHAFVVSE